MRPFLGTALLMALAACRQASAPTAVSVEEAWVQLPPVAGRPGTAYFTLRSSGGGARLTGVSSPQVGRIELHETRTEGGIARMAPLAKAPFGKDGTLAFAPGGKHAMLFAIDPAARPGGKITLTFSVEPVGAVSAEVDVRAFGAVHADH